MNTTHDAIGRIERLAAHALTSFQTDPCRSAVAFALVDDELRCVRVNGTMATLTGLPIDAHVGRSVADTFAAVWRDVEPHCLEVLHTGEAVLGLEVDLSDPADPSHERRWSASFSPVSLDGEVAGIVFVLVDITAATHAENELRFQSKLIDLSGQAIIAVEPVGTIISWNEAAGTLSGWSAAEAMGRDAFALVPRRESAEQAAEIAAAMQRGESWSGDCEICRRDGRWISVFVTHIPVLDEDGVLLAVIVSFIDLTGQLGAQRALEASRQRLADAQRIAHLGSFEVDLVDGAVTWSDELHRIIGTDPDAGASLDLFRSVVHPDDFTTMRDAWMAAITDGTGSDIEFRIVRPDGEVRFVRSRGIAERGDDGSIRAVSGTLLDDTENVEARRVRRTAEMQFEIGFEQSTVGAVIADLDGLPTRVNSAVCAILGRGPEELLGQRWTSFTHPDDPPLGAIVLQAVAAGHESHEDERRYIRPDGRIVWAIATVTLVRGEDGQPEYYFMQLRDNTTRKELEVELAHQALHDSLTGLPNRVLLADRLVHALATSRRHGTQLGVIFLDIDEFKFVNDSSGHTIGDDLLRDAARRITEVVRPDDTVARFGGDEFVVVCDDVSDIEVEEIAQRVLAALGRTWVIRGNEIRVTASLGVAIADEHSTPETLLRDSDAAMYRAKERGKGRVEMFDEELRLKAEHRFSTASQLHLALDRGEFVNFYQPAVDLRTGAMVGVEALVRWNHPTRGVLAPAEFITLAEDTGLIVPIGEWVLEQACRDVVTWRRIQRDQGIDSPLWLAVNLSVRQLLADDIVATIGRVLAETGLDPAALCLELTESVLMEDAEYFGRTLAGLKALGVGLAIDDFGTGYSSINYLRRFPVDTVKVDRGFVDGLGTEPHDTALVAAIVAMAGALELDVVAEGVETKEQMKILDDLGVGLAQGFVFAQPAPAAEIDALVRCAHHWPVA